MSNIADAQSIFEHVTLCSNVPLKRLQPVGCHASSRRIVYGIVHLALVHYALGWDWSFFMLDFEIRRGTQGKRNKCGPFSIH